MSQQRSGNLLLTLNFQDETIMLNKDIIETIGYPKQVQILINKESKRLLLRPCATDSCQAIVIPTAAEPQVEIGGRQLLRKIRKLAGWENEQPRICVGELIQDYQAVVFDLPKAIAVLSSTASPA